MANAKPNLLETLKENIGVLLMVVVALAAFGFAYSQFAQPQEKQSTVNGITVFATGSVRAAIAEILSPQVIATQVVLDNESDGRPCKVPMQTEALYGLATSGKNASFQILVKDANYCLKSAGASSSARVECVKPRLVVQDGDCNCMRLDARNQTVVISGSEDWLCASGPNVREILAWGLGKQ